MIDPERFVTERLRDIDASGIRRVFDLAANLESPVNLSIGQPDFPVPEPIKRAAAEAIDEDKNGYTVTQGIPPLRDKIDARLRAELPVWDEAGFATLVTSGVSGGLLLALLTCAEPGDEVLIPDPYFVMYRHLVALTGATPVMVDTYPDFELTAERVAAKLTDRSKVLLFNAPANPTGAVASDAACRQLVELADARDLLLISDEIYDVFTYDGVERPAGSGVRRCPSPAAYSADVLLLRGFSKTYAMTGWRLGYAAGPAPLIDQMTKLQQYSFVCAPSMVQRAGVAALDVDMSEQVARFRRRRDRVIERLGDRYEIAEPGGAFYAFPKVPEQLGETATDFVKRAIDRELLLIPGSVFSERDTHFRLSYACDEQTLETGLAILRELAEP